MGCLAQKQGLLLLSKRKGKAERAYFLPNKHMITALGQIKCPPNPLPVSVANSVSIE